ncbi:MAG: response regulator transcription factor [Candidatus Korobacteraceae bacterium]|jgi:DNA-binding NarL/FixJ family response regulator
MDPLTGYRSSTHRSRRKLTLFCRHPVAQERFGRLLSKAGFDVVVSSELRLQNSDSPAHQATPASLVILDCSDAEAAVEFVHILHIQQPNLPILVLLPKLEGPHTYSLLRLGVKGVLAYGQAPRELSRAACQVAGGGYCVPRELLTGFIESILPELYGSKSLTPEREISRREREVLDLLLENLSNKEIAAKLFVAERTVKFHVSNLLSKFGVHRRADLIVMWMRQATAFPWQSREREQSISTRVN